MGKKPFSTLAITAAIFGVVALVCAMLTALAVYAWRFVSNQWIHRVFWSTTGGLIFFIFSYLVLGVLALILGLLARRKILKSNHGLRGNGLAIFGIVTGVLLAVFWFFTTFKFIGMMMQY